jgi:hypothetical protein
MIEVMLSLRNALVLLAGSALLAGCGGSNGANSSDVSAVYGQSSSLPSSAAGPAGTSGGTTASSSGASSSAGRSSSASHPGASSTSAKPGGGGHTTTGTTTTPPSGGGGGGGIPANCVQSTSAGAHIVVCPGKHLADGTQVKVTGDHFHPKYAGKPEGLLVMECHYKGEAADNYGPNDCTINILNLAPNSTSVRSDGTFGPFTLTVHVKFKSVNCANVQCMVTAAQPIQSEAADNPHALISFG